MNQAPISIVDLGQYRQLTQRFSYNVFDLLGGGNYGKVYRGWDKKNKLHIAVKNIPRKKLYQLNGSEKQEINMLDRLQHINIIEFYGSYGGRDNPDGLFLFLQLCSGGSLSDYIVKNKPTEKQSMRLFEQLIDGMIYVNSQQIFHRDLKPDNLLLTERGDLKIADFGIARQLGQGQSTYPPQVYLYQLYQQQGQRYSQKCDVFSAGYILYQMLTGEPFITGITTQPQLNAFLRKNMNPGFKIEHPALSQRWITLLQEMLNFKPELRPTFAQIKQKIRDYQPSDSPPAERPRKQDDIQFSANLVEKVRTQLLEQQKVHNKLLRILKILQINQLSESNIIPRVYKLLMLYFSLARYCMLVEQGIQYLNSPEKIAVGSQTLGNEYNVMVGEDKKNLLVFVEEMAARVNKAVEQIKTLMTRQIVPELEMILKGEQGIQQNVVREFKLNLQRYRSGEYQSYSFYTNSLKNCVNNIYQTSAVVQTLGEGDLRTYLVLLQAILEQRWIQLPAQLKQKIGQSLSVQKVVQLPRCQLIVCIEGWKSAY